MLVRILPLVNGFTELKMLPCVLESGGLTRVVLPSRLRYTARLFKLPLQRLHQLEIISTGVIV